MTEEDLETTEGETSDHPTVRGTTLSALYIVNWWPMKWGSQDLTQGDRCGTVLPRTLTVTSDPD